MLSPKRTKFRRHHRGRRKGKSSRGNSMAFGELALQAMEPGWISSRQIEAGRRAISRCARRGGQVWIRVFPDKPITARAAETRMGSGKGTPEYWACRIKPGRILFELDGIDEALAKRAFELGAAKLPISTKFVTRGIKL